MDGMVEGGCKIGSLVDIFYGWLCQSLWMVPKRTEQGDLTQDTINDVDIENPT